MSAWHKLVSMLDFACDNLKWLGHSLAIAYGSLDKSSTPAGWLQQCGLLFLPVFSKEKWRKSICKSCVTESSINCLASPTFCIFNSAGRRLFPAATFAQHLHNTCSIHSSSNASWTMWISVSTIYLHSHFSNGFLFCPNPKEAVFQFSYMTRVTQNCNKVHYRCFMDYVLDHLWDLFDVFFHFYFLLYFSRVVDRYW